MNLKNISKSRFINGLQCEKRLWMEIHKREWMDEVDERTQAVFDQGHQVGELAQKLYPNGVLISEDHLHIKESVKSTEKAVQDGAPTLYEAGAIHDRLMCRADILNRVKSSDAWDMIEVKSSTEVKDVYLYDLAFQKYVFEQSGTKIRKTFLCHINTHYVRKGELELEKLFWVEDVTHQTDRLIKKVPELVEKLFETVDSKREPEKPIGPHCKNPYACSFYGHCWKKVPDDSILTSLTGRKDYAFDLYHRGIVKVVDMPKEIKLSERQKRQVEVARTGKPFWNEKAVKNYLKTLVYPLSFLDFEAFTTVVPAYDGMQPYHYYPCQFSLHILDKPEGKLRHFEFLAEANADPRPAFSQALAERMPDKGSVITYSPYEKNMLLHTAEFLPSYRAPFNQIIKRMSDLAVIFQKRDVVFPGFNGSASIKAVLPVLVPTMSYDNLEIGEGGAACDAFVRLMDPDLPKKEREKIRKALLTYCGQDTMAMVKLLEVLKKEIAI